MELTELQSRHPQHARMAAAIRVLTLDAVARANSGHSGMPIGMADVATVLWSKHLKFDATAPDWFDRDRFVLSAGHGSMLIYALAHLAGFGAMPMTEIKNFRQWGSRTAGHPEYGHAPGVETTTGPLGQGLANAVGMAIAEEHLRSVHGADLCDHHTYVIAGDGCLMEGISQEALTLAGRQRLSRLVVFWDNNNITIDGEVSLADSTDQLKRFKASGWHVQSIDGHDPEAIDAAIIAAKEARAPSLIACTTHIALGTAAQDTSKGHGAITNPEHIAAARVAYGWEAEPFVIPEDVSADWAKVGQRGQSEREAWQGRVGALPDPKREAFLSALSGEIPKRLAVQMNQLKRRHTEDPKPMATRKASELALEVVNKVMRTTVGGSADLTGSNNTLTEGLGVFDYKSRKGRYIHFGIREHGMAAAMNGMAVHGGVRPYGGTFMVFADYARPAMRLAALMKTNPVFVMTHDSIGVGEDGPTHQPVEHLAALRAIPNMLVIRPADAVETAEAWEVALMQADRPTTLALSRQNLPLLRTQPSGANRVAQGAYILADAEGERQAVLMASGSEVCVAMAAREQLQAEGIGTRVVSMPCWELFEEQDEALIRKVLGGGSVRVAVEAGVRQGWDRWLCGAGGNEKRSGFVGMNGFGASAPAERLFAEFGITAEAVAANVKALL